MRGASVMRSAERMTGSATPRNCSRSPISATPRTAMPRTATSRTAIPPAPIPRTATPRTAAIEICAITNSNSRITYRFVHRRLPTLSPRAPRSAVSRLSGPPRICPRPAAATPTANTGVGAGIDAVTRDSRHRNPGATVHAPEGYSWHPPTGRHWMERGGAQGGASASANLAYAQVTSPESANDWARRGPAPRPLPGECVRIQFACRTHRTSSPLTRPVVRGNAASSPPAMPSVMPPEIFSVLRFFFAD